jgi:beta-lactam-binding protein with PASTA domain
MLYSEKNSTRTSVTVPDLKDMTLTQAKAALKNKNLNISYTGTGTISSQNIKKGTSVEEGTIIKVTLSY